MCLSSPGRSPCRVPCSTSSSVWLSLDGPSRHPAPTRTRAECGGGRRPPWSGLTTRPPRPVPSGLGISRAPPALARPVSAGRKAEETARRPNRSLGGTRALRGPLRSPGAQSRAGRAEQDQAGPGHEERCRTLRPDTRVSQRALSPLPWPRQNDCFVRGRAPASPRAGDCSRPGRVPSSISARSRVCIVPCPAVFRARLPFSSLGRRKFRAFLRLSSRLAGSVCARLCSWTNVEMFYNTLLSLSLPPSFND